MSERVHYRQGGPRPRRFLKPSLMRTAAMAGLIMTLAACVTGPVQVSQLRVTAQEKGPVASLEQAAGYLKSRSIEDPSNYMAVLNFAGTGLSQLPAEEQALLSDYARVFGDIALLASGTDADAASFGPAGPLSQAPDAASKHLSRISADWASRELLSLYTLNTGRVIGARTEELMAHLATHHSAGLDQPDIRSQTQDILIQTRLTAAAREPSTAFQKVEDAAFRWQELASLLGAETPIAEPTPAVVAEPASSGFSLGSFLGTTPAEPAAPEPAAPVIPDEERFNYLVQLLSAEALTHRLSPSQVAPVLSDLTERADEMTDTTRQRFDTAFAAYLPDRFIQDRAPLIPANASNHRLMVLTGLEAALDQNRLSSDAYGKFLAGWFDALFDAFEDPGMSLYLARRLCEHNATVCAEKMPSGSRDRSKPMQKAALLMAGVSAAQAGRPLVEQRDLARGLSRFLQREAAGLPVEVQQVLVRDTMGWMAEAAPGDAIRALQRYLRRGRDAELPRGEVMSILTRALSNEGAGRVSTSTKSAIRDLIQDDPAGALQQLETVLGSWSGKDLYDLARPALAEIRSAPPAEKAALLSAFADLFEDKILDLSSSERDQLYRLVSREVRNAEEDQRLPLSQAGLRMLKGAVAQQDKLKQDVWELYHGRNTPMPGSDRIGPAELSAVQ